MSLPPGSAVALPVLAAVVVFDAFCLVGLARAEKVRYLPKWGWVLVICVWGPWGGLVYLSIGRAAGAAPGLANAPAEKAGRAADGPRVPRHGPVSPVVIEVDQLTKRFGLVTAVDGLSFVVRPGHVTGFLGPNGAGKTTTLRMLLGLVRPSAGGGRVLGAPLTSPARYLGRVGALIESPAFYPSLSGTRNLMVQATLGGLDPARIPALLDRVDLAGRAEDPYRTYSLGMKQRLAIAAALLGDPARLILDEPTNGLDPAGIREMRGLVRSLADDGPTIMISSHLLSEVQQACDWLVMIKEGRRVFQGSTAQLLAAGGDELVLGCQHPADLPRLGDLLTRRGLHWARDGSRLRVPLRQLQADLERAGGLSDQIAEINTAAMTEDLTLVELTTTHASLEDRYETLMAEGAR